MLRLTPGSGLFLTLTFENRPSIQCNLEGVSLSRKISHPYRNFSVGEGFGKILSVLGGPKPLPVYGRLARCFLPCNQVSKSTISSAIFQSKINKIGVFGSSSIF